jgi:ABC-2 type transport system ATP-binding protein
MADVEALCKRIIVIHHGRILFDGDLSKLVDRFSTYKTVGITLDKPSSNLESYGEVMVRDGSRVTLRVLKTKTSEVTARLLADLNVDDLTVEDPPIEDVIEHVFSSPAESVE